MKVLIEEKLIKSTAYRGMGRMKEAKEVMEAIRNQQQHESITS